MDAATHICTSCGYEGKPVKPPSDATYEGQSDSSKAIARVANLIFPGLGLIIRPLAMFLLIPVYIVLWIAKQAFGAGKKHCPNCGLPLMVKLSSDAGFVAKRKQDVKSGLVSFDPNAPKPVTSFGREVVLPGDEIKPEAQKVAPRTNLGTLDELLKDEEPAPAPEPEQEAHPQPKRTVDPDQW